MAMERWIGRVALVTGASVGIGAAVAEKLVQHGMKVVGCARNVQKIQELADKLQGEKGSLLPIKCDLKKEEEILSMFAEIKKQYGGVDVCINNAGLAHSCKLIDGETAKWQDMLDVNVLALCVCTREAVQSMKERGVDDGHIIHLNSMSGHRLTHGGGHFYCASKFAVTALTEGLRNELREMNSNIRVSAVSPGVVKTEFAIRMSGEERGKKLYETLPVLSADDVADTVTYILSAPSHVQVHDVLMRPTGQKS